MKYLLIFLAGVLCPFVVAFVWYVVWSALGKNTGWPA